MSFIDWLTRALRTHGDDEREALAVVVREAEREEAVVRESRERAPREMRRLRNVPAITFGTSLDRAGNPFPVLLNEDEVRGGGHWLITGATGSGKSFLALGVISQILRRRASGLVLIDMKGELAKICRETVLPALVAELPGREAASLLSRIAVVAPFDDAATPPFQLLARDRSLPIEVQAHEVASSFGRTIGRDLGVLQGTLLKYTLLLAIDVGLTLPEVRDLLQDPAFLRGAVERTTLPDVRAYFAERFPRERAGSVASLLSRLDSLLMYPTLKKMLSARGMIRFDRLLERAITIIDLGGAPAGMHDVSRFFGQLMFQKICRATFSRQVGPRTMPVSIIADEFQEMLSPEIAHDFERFLTLARSQKVFLSLLFQQPAQVESVAPSLLRILRTNAAYQVMFRSSLEDARPLAHILPVIGNVPRESRGFPDPRTPPVMISADDERRLLLEQVPSMPDRVFWFWNRRRPYPAILVKSATLDMRAMSARATRLPPEVRAVARRGILAVGERELTQTIAERARRRDELAGRPAAVANDQREARCATALGVDDGAAAAGDRSDEPPTAIADMDRQHSPPPRRGRGVALG